MRIFAFCVIFVRHSLKQHHFMTRDVAFSRSRIVTDMCSRQTIFLVRPACDVTHQLCLLVLTFVQIAVF